MSLLVVNKKDVVREAIETPHYFEIQGMLCGLEIKGLIDDEGEFYASVLKQVAQGHDCYETVVDILTKLGVRGDMRNWIDNADNSICPSCGLEVNNPAKTDGRCPKCDFQDPRYGEMTNRRHLEALSDHDLAATLIIPCVGETVDYDWEENPIEDLYTFWRTSDGEEFLNYDEAIDHEARWLRQPYGEEMR